MGEDASVLIYVREPLADSPDHALFLVSVAVLAFRGLGHGRRESILLLVIAHFSGQGDCIFIHIEEKCKLWFRRQEG